MFKNRLYVLLFLLVVVFSINFSLAIDLPEDYTCADKRGSECNGGAGCNSLAIDYLEINPGASEEEIENAIATECKCEGFIECSIFQQVAGECVPGGYFPTCPDKCTFIEDSDCGDGIIQNYDWRYFNIEGQEQCDFLWDIECDAIWEGVLNPDAPRCRTRANTPSIRNSSYWYEQGCVPPYETDENGESIGRLDCTTVLTGEFFCWNYNALRMGIFNGTVAPKGADCPEGATKIEHTRTVCPPQPEGPDPCTQVSNPYSESGCTDGIDSYDDLCDFGVIPPCEAGQIHLLTGDCEWECKCPEPKKKTIEYANNLSVTSCEPYDSFHAGAGFSENLDSCVLYLDSHFTNASIAIKKLRVIDYTGKVVYSEDISDTVSLDEVNSYYSEEVYPVDLTSYKGDPIALTCVFDLKSNDDPNVCIDGCSTYGSSFGDFDNDGYYSFAQAKALNNSYLNCSRFNVNVEGEDDWPFDDLVRNKDCPLVSGPTPNCEKYPAEGEPNYWNCAYCLNKTQICSPLERSKFIEKCESGSQTGYWLRGVGWFESVDYAKDYNSIYETPNSISSLSCDYFVQFESFKENGIFYNNKIVHNVEYLTYDGFIEIIKKVEIQANNPKSQDLANSIFLLYMDGAGVRITESAFFPGVSYLNPKKSYLEYLFNYILRHPEFYSGDTRHDMDDRTTISRIRNPASGDFFSYRWSQSKIYRTMYPINANINLIKKVYLDGNLISMSHLMEIASCTTTPILFPMQFVYDHLLNIEGKDRPNNFNGDLMGVLLKRYINPNILLLHVYMPNPDYTPKLSDALGKLKSDFSSKLIRKSLSTDKLRKYCELMTEYNVMGCLP